MRAARGILTGLLLMLMLAGCGGGGGGGGDSVDPPSSVTTLADLTLSAGDLDQAFQSNQFVYSATVGFLTTVTTVTPTTSDAAVTVIVNGLDVVSGSASTPIPLTVGANTLTVIVTAEDGVSTSTYTVTVTRESQSSVATLANLELSAGSLEQTFQSGLFDYTATVGFLTTATTVTTATTDAVATVTVNGVAVTSGSASAPIPLTVGANTLTVIVTAEDGVSTSTYTVTVTRESQSNVATLAHLELSAGSLEQTFQSSLFDYTATVGYPATETMVTPTTADAAATVTVNGVTVASGSASAQIPLVVGKNTLTVIVTAEDGVSTGTYTVSVTRESPSAVATLADLALSAGDLDQVFQSDQFVYTASVGFLTTATTVTPTTTDAAATVSVNGVAVTSGSASAPIPLTVGANTLTVIVTAEDGVSTSTYTVTVTRESTSEFAQQAYLKASNPEVADQFGYSIALSGDTLAVGAWLDDNNDNSLTDSGAVYVFIRNGTVWSQQAYIKASNAGSGNRFGNSVALSGDTLAVGAYREEQRDASRRERQQPEAGVYVFTRSGAVWSQQAYIKASNAGSGDRFGWSVALSGDTLAVGAYLEDSNDNGLTDNSGAVYVFTRSGTVWTQQAYVKASNADSDDNFGYSVALYGDVLAVGATEEDSNATGIQQGSPSDPSNNDSQNSGAVYIFNRSGTTWTQQAYIKASNPGINNVFGWSLALNGETLAVGAPFESAAPMVTRTCQAPSTYSPAVAWRGPSRPISRRPMPALMINSAGAWPCPVMPWPWGPGGRTVSTIAWPMIAAPSISLPAAARFGRSRTTSNLPSPMAVTFSVTASPSPVTRWPRERRGKTVRHRRRWRCPRQQPKRLRRCLRIPVTIRPAPFFRIHRQRGVPLSALTLYITRPCSRQFPVPGFIFAGGVQNRQVGIAGHRHRR